MGMYEFISAELHTCIRCKTTVHERNVQWFGSFPFCKSCFSADDSDCHKRYRYKFSDEMPETIMPGLLDADIVNSTVLDNDIIIEEYIPLADVVHPLKKISEKFTADPRDQYAGDFTTESICVNPFTNKYYLVENTQSGPAFSHWGDHTSSRSLVLKEMVPEDLPDEVIGLASQVRPGYPSYVREFPLHTKKPNITPLLKACENAPSGNMLPDKLYCCDFDFDYGAEYCYLRRVNGDYRLFYLKRFKKGYNKIDKVCSEEFINSVFARIDSFHQYPLPRDYGLRKGTSLIFGDRMPVSACDRKLTGSECKAISAVFAYSKNIASDHKINGFSVMLSKDNYKIVELTPNSEATRILFQLLVNIAKYGL